MLRLLNPDAVYESLYAVDLDELKARGIRGLIVDLDNTLIAYDYADVTEQARQWVAAERTKSTCPEASRSSGARTTFAAPIGND